MNKSKFTDVERYVWGLRDGQADIKHHRPIRFLPLVGSEENATFKQDRPLPTWDKAYCSGYRVGLIATIE